MEFDIYKDVVKATTQSVNRKYLFLFRVFFEDSTVRADRPIVTVRGSKDRAKWRRLSNKAGPGHQGESLAVLLGQTLG